jgi:hypothetical protein
MGAIVVDREAMIARFHARRVPGLAPEMEKARKSDGNEGFVVSCQGARIPSTPFGLTKDVRSRSLRVSSRPQFFGRDETLGAKRRSGTAHRRPSRFKCPS